MPTRTAGLACKMEPQPAPIMMDRGYLAIARKYLCPDDPNKCGSDVQYLYAWKVARHCNGEAYCMEVKDVFQDIDGNSYTCNLYDYYANPANPPLLGTFDMNNADLFFLRRSYMEPATNVGPDDNELLYDRAIYFGPYFAVP